MHSKLFVVLISLVIKIVWCRINVNESYLYDDYELPWIKLNAKFINETIEGDMIVSANQNLFIQNRYLPQGSNMLWPNGRIPYEFGASFSASQQNIFNRAINWWNNHTCIRWVRRSSADTDYVNVDKSGGCRSVIGRVRGRQVLSLENGCFNSLSTVIHEMMHSVGFIHEHQRPDRDQYVTTFMQNVKPGQESQFRIFRDTRHYFGDYKLSYDIQSVMHYTEMAFSNGRGKTIEAKDKRRLSCVREASCPTSLDTKKINAVYRCPTIVG